MKNTYHCQLFDDYHGNMEKIRKTIRVISNTNEYNGLTKSERIFTLRRLCDYVKDALYLEMFCEQEGFDANSGNNLVE